MQIGLAKEGDVLDGTVVRQKKAYPVYDDDYAKHVSTIVEELEARFPNLHLVGRNGMHKYNNQDHAMMTAMLCVENILADTKLYDLWAGERRRRIPRRWRSGGRADHRHRAAAGAVTRQNAGAGFREAVSFDTKFKGGAAMRRLFVSRAAS